MPKVPGVPGMPRVLCLIAAAIVMPVSAQGPGAELGARISFEAATRGEAVATLTVQCDPCAWDLVGREAVMISIAMDGRYSQHLPVLRSGRADYRVLLGPVEPGAHTIQVSEDAALSAKSLRGGRARVERIDVAVQAVAAPEYRALSLAPMVYARPDTVGRFTDVPIFMWYEVEPTARGTRYRYSVIFTNEDGGTPADRLMATWGRTTDIEYLYSVEVDGSGAIVEDDMQGPEHEILPFRGRREGSHPLLWVSTENNMVLDRGTTTVRYAPAPVAFPLTQVSREAIMDAHPWTYDIMSRELAREGKIVPDAPPGQGTIPDPRRFVYLEGCGEVGDRALAFAVRAGDRWFASDRGVPQYRITRDGCFRAATPLPAGLSSADVRGVRAQAYPREGRAGSAAARLTRVNTVFMLDEQFVPGSSLATWRGSTELQAGGPSFDLPVRFSP